MSPKLQQLLAELGFYILVIGTLVITIRFIVTGLTFKF